MKDLMAEGSAHGSESHGFTAASTSDLPTMPASERPKPARWTLIEQFEHEGFCYRFSRRPVEHTHSGPRLTSREREALNYAHRGYNNKLIARALGVAPSTVGVLLFRAAAKVGAKSRLELLQAYARLEME